MFRVHVVNSQEKGEDLPPRPAHDLFRLSLSVACRHLFHLSAARMSCSQSRSLLRSQQREVGDQSGLSFILLQIEAG